MRKQIVQDDVPSRSTDRDMAIAQGARMKNRSPIHFAPFVQRGGWCSMCKGKAGRGVEVGTSESFVRICVRCIRRINSANVDVDDRPPFDGLGPCADARHDRNDRCAQAEDDMIALMLLAEGPR